ncbi:MAG: hypothetical protein NT080_14350 [Spirochaetes bacterium]|nr:hypothetical protein [Spirochaetota bacterium]
MPSNNLKKLADELLSEIDGLGEAELEFLLGQARILRSSLENAGDDDGIEAERGKETSAANAAAREPMRIERSSDGSSFHIVANGKWKLFASEEMTALARIALADIPPDEARLRVYRWLDRERRDVFGDLGITGPSSPALSELIGLLKASLTIAKRNSARKA